MLLLGSSDGKENRGRRVGELDEEERERKRDVRRHGQDGDGSKYRGRRAQELEEGGLRRSASRIRGQLHGRDFLRGVGNERKCCEEGHGNSNARFSGNRFACECCGACGDGLDACSQRSASCIYSPLAGRVGLAPRFPHSPLDDQMCFLSIFSHTDRKELHLVRKCRLCPCACVSNPHSFHQL